MNDSLRRLSIAAYAVAALFIVFATLDIVANAWPGFAPGDEQWRYGLAGIVSNYLVSIVFGVLLAALTAAIREDALVLRILAAFSGLTIVCLVVQLLLLVLDVIQLNSFVNAQDAGMFRIGALKAAGKLGVGAVVLGFLVVTCVRAARVIRIERREIPLVR